MSWIHPSAAIPHGSWQADSGELPSSASQDTGQSQARVDEYKDSLKAPAEFTAVEMLEMMNMAIELDPYIIPRGEKGKQWDKVAHELQRQNLCTNS